MGESLNKKCRHSPLRLQCSTRNRIKINPKAASTNRCKHRRLQQQNRESSTRRILGIIRQICQISTPLALTSAAMTSYQGILGLTLLKDINPGTNGSDPSNFINFNNTLYFRARDATNGYELWKSDGTTAGTVLLKDINPGTDSSDPDDFFNFKNTLYFVAGDAPTAMNCGRAMAPQRARFYLRTFILGLTIKTLRTSSTSTTPYISKPMTVNGIELWKSDGTAAGTVLLKDINPGTNTSDPENFININNTLYFQADDGTNGYELWKSDGTAAGTVLLKDINPGTNNSDLSNFINFNNTLYFTARDATNGIELWKIMAPQRARFSLIH